MLITRIRGRQHVANEWHLCVTFVVACFGAACCRMPSMEPLPPRYDNMSLSGVPLILAGQALEGAAAVEPPLTSRWDERPVQLRKVKVRVEHIFSGQLSDKVVNIYYFTDLGAIGGSAVPVTIKKGLSYLFFLQRDKNKWRSICEDWNTCIIRVPTGSHYGKWARTSGATPEQDCVDFVMSRGDNTTDDQMVDVVKHPPARWSWGPVFRRILQIAKEDPSPRVRLAAQTKAEELEREYGGKLRPQ